MGADRLGATSLRTDTSGGANERPFDRILIANRGEIALRIIRTCDAMGIETVAIFSDADVNASHVEAATIAVRIGPAPAGESYLRGDAIIAAAIDTGSQAIHPGYGFLSERAAFAQAVVDAGLTFIGPDVAAIAALGDKLAARRTARAARVPVVPGTFEPALVDRPDQVDALATAAERIGFPIMVKAAAGGGGRGMRRVERVEDLPAALAAGSAESAAAFGDGTVYLERVIQPARHVEVQLLGDHHGTIVALGERDCSIQRRHQKLVEESPAPGLTTGQRRALHAMAVTAAKAAGLHNAATAEFLVDTEGQPHFLEVNARLQVEHGVTELVTDLDLVAEQLWIAAGAPLRPEVISAAERAATPDRHAIEIRLSAEDPGRAFAPAPGRIGDWSMPTGEGVRVDTAARAGDRIPPDYDPLVAKILTVGPDRDTAVVRMRDALDAVVVTGIQTTLPFHRLAMRHPAFVAGSLSTDFVADHIDLDAARASALAAAVPIAAQEAVDRGVSVRTDTGPTASRWSAAGRKAAIDRWPR